MRVILIIIFALASTYSSFAQAENKIVRKGNGYYEDGKYKDAEISYRKALEKEPRSLKSSYNLANSLYKQDSYEEAANSYLNAINKLGPNQEKQKAASFHNLGNTLVKEEKYQEAIDAYKQALRINPSDEDTRYNLVYAMNKLQQQQNQQNSKSDKSVKRIKNKRSRKSNQITSPSSENL